MSDIFTLLDTLNTISLHYAFPLNFSDTGRSNSAGFITKRFVCSVIGGLVVIDTKRRQDSPNVASKPTKMDSDKVIFAGHCVVIES